MRGMRQLTTAEQLLAMPDEGQRCELVCGELRSMSPGGCRHGDLANYLGGELHRWNRGRRHGRAYGADTGFVLARDPDTVLAPDVAFVRRERMQAVAAAGYFPGPPDLAVEVRSPRDSQRAVAAKAAEWLQHGCPLVWTVDGDARTVTVHRAGANPRILHADEVLTGGEDLPGFELPLAELFAD